MKLMKHLALVGLMIAMLFSLWACGDELVTTGDINDKNPGTSGTPGEGFVQGDKVGIKQIDGDSWRLMYYELASGAETTLREFFDTYMSTSGGFEAIASDYTWTVDGVAADGSAVVKKGSNIVATAKDGDVQTPADGQMKLNVTIYDPVSGSQMGAGIVVDGTSITLKAFFETYISGGSQTFEAAAKDYEWYVDGKLAKAETALNATSVITAKMLNTSGGSNNKPQPENPNPENPNPENPNPENPNPENPGGFEQGDKIGVRHESGDSFRVMYFDMNENELTLREFFDTYIVGTSGGTTFDEQEALYTWTVDGQPATATTPVKAGSNIVAVVKAAEPTLPEEGQIKLPVTIFNPESGMQQGMGIIVDAETIKLGEFFETYVSGGSQSFEEAAEEYEWYVDGKPADANTTLNKNSEITAVPKETGEGPVNPGPGPGTNKETITFSYRFIDLNGDVIQSGGSTVTLYEGETYTLADVATQQFRFESFTESLLYGYYEINDRRVNDANTLIANGDEIVYVQTVSFPDAPPADTCEITFAVMQNGTVVSSNTIELSAEGLRLEQVFDDYLNGTPGLTFADTLEDGEWLVEGLAADADTIIKDGYIVTYVLDSSDPNPDNPNPDDPNAGETLMTPDDGEVLLRLDYGLGVSEQIFAFEGTMAFDKFYGEFLASVLGGDYELVCEVYIVTVNGAAVTSETVVTEKSVIRVVLKNSYPTDPPEADEMLVTLTMFTGETAMQRTGALPVGTTLKAFYEEYLGGSAFEDSLLSYVWTVNGAPADANTVLTDGCQIVATFEIAPDANTITFVMMSTSGTSSTQTVAIEESELTLLALYGRYLDPSGIFGFEEFLQLGYFLVNDEPATKETIVRAGDTVTFVMVEDEDEEFEITFESWADGDSWETTVTIEGTEITLADLVNEYLYRYVDAEFGSEAYELSLEFGRWQVNGVDASANTIVTDEDTVSFIWDVEDQTFFEITLEVGVWGEPWNMTVTVEGAEISLKDLVNEYLYAELGISDEDPYQWTLDGGYCWLVNGEAADADTVVTADDVVTFTQASDDPDDDDEYVTFETVFNGEVMDSVPIYIAESELTLSDLFYLYLGADGSFESTLAVGSWTVNGVEADASTVVTVGDKVVYTVTLSTPSDDGTTILTPDEGQVIVKINTGDSINETLYVLEQSSYTLVEFFEIYLMGESGGSLDLWLEMFTIYVNGEIADGNTVITEQSVVSFVPTFAFPSEEPEEGEIKITFIEIDEKWARTDFRVIDEGRTLKWYYEYYIGGGSFASTLLSYEWLVNGEVATAETVLTADCVITMTFRVAEGAFAIEFGSVWGDSSYGDRLVLEGSEITLLGLFEFINDTEDSFESFLEKGYWTVNGELADADTVIRSGDKVVYVRITTDFSIYVSDGDFQVWRDIEIVVPEGMTFREFIEAYLELDGDFEDYEWRDADGELLTGDEILSGIYDWVEISATRIGAEESVPGDGEIKVTVSVDSETDSTQNAYIIPDTGMTLREFYEAYLSDGNETFDQSVLHISWYVNDEQADGDTVLTADAYIYAQWYDPDMPDDHININGDMERNGDVEHFSYGIWNGVTLYDLFYQHLYYQYGLIGETDIEDWAWYVDGTEVTDYLFALYDGAYVFLEYIGEEGGDIVDPSECDHDKIPTGVQCPSCGLIVFLRYEIYFEGKHVYTYNFYDEFSYLAVKAVLSEVFSEADDWNLFIRMYSVTVNETEVTDWDYFVYNGDTIYVQYRSSEDECHHDWDPTTGTCRLCWMPCPEDHNQYFGVSCPTCGFNTNGGELQHVIVTLVMDGSFNEVFLTMRPDEMLTLEYFLDFALSQMGLNPSVAFDWYDITVDGVPADSGDVLVHNLSTVELTSKQGGGDNPPVMKHFEILGIQYLPSEYEWDDSWWMKPWVMRYTADREITLNEALEHFSFYDVGNCTIWVNGEIVTDYESCVFTEDAYIAVVHNNVPFTPFTVTYVDTTTGERRVLRYDHPVFFEEVRDLLFADFDWANNEYTITFDGYDDGMIMGNQEAFAVNVTITVRVMTRSAEFGIVDENNHMGTWLGSFEGALPTVGEFIEQYLGTSADAYRCFDLNGGEVRELFADDELPLYYVVFIPKDQVKNPITVTYHVTTVEGEVLEGTFTLENPSVLGYIFSNREDDGTYFPFVDAIDQYSIKVNGEEFDGKMGIWYALIWGDCDVVVVPAYMFGLEYWGNGDFEGREPIKVSDPSMTLRDVLALFELDLNKYTMNGDPSLDTPIGDFYMYGYNTIYLTGRYVNFSIEILTTDGYSTICSIYEQFKGSVTLEELLQYAAEHGMFDLEGWSLYIKDETGRMVEVTDPSYTWSVPEGQSSVEYFLFVQSDNVFVSWEICDRSDIYIRGDYLEIPRGTTVAELLEMLNLNAADFSKIIDRDTWEELMLDTVLEKSINVRFTQSSADVYLTLKDDRGNIYFEGWIPAGADSTFGELLAQYTEYTWDVVKYAYSNEIGDVVADTLVGNAISVDVTLNFFTVYFSIFDINGMSLVNDTIDVLGSITVGEVLEKYGHGYKWEDIAWGDYSMGTIDSPDLVITHEDKISLTVKAGPFTVWYNGTPYELNEPVTIYEFITWTVGEDFYAMLQNGYWRNLETLETIDWADYTLSDYCSLEYVTYEGANEQMNVTLIFNGDVQNQVIIYSVGETVTLDYAINQFSNGALDFALMSKQYDVYVDGMLATSGMDPLWEGATIELRQKVDDRLTMNVTFTMEGEKLEVPVKYMPGEIVTLDMAIKTMGDGGGFDFFSTFCNFSINGTLIESGDFILSEGDVIDMTQKGDGTIEAFTFTMVIDGRPVERSLALLPDATPTLNELLQMIVGYDFETYTKLLQCEIWVNGVLAENGDVIVYHMSMVEFVTKTDGEGGGEVGGEVTKEICVYFEGQKIVLKEPILISEFVDRYLKMDFSSTLMHGYWTVDGIWIDDYYMLDRDCWLEYIPENTDEPNEGCAHMYSPETGNCEYCGQPCPEDHSMYIGMVCPNCGFYNHGGMMASEHFFHFYVNGEYRTYVSRYLMPGEYVTLDDLLWEAFGQSIDEFMGSYEMLVNGELIQRYGYEIYGDAEIHLNELAIAPQGYEIYINGMPCWVDAYMSLADAISLHSGMGYGESLAYGYWTVDGMPVEDAYNYFFDHTCKVEYVKNEYPEYGYDYVA